MYKNIRVDCGGERVNSTVTGVSLSFFSLIQQERIFLCSVETGDNGVEYGEWSGMKANSFLYGIYGHTCIHIIIISFAISQQVFSYEL